MAMRGSPARRVVGSPLAGVLGHLNQRARIGGRQRATGAPAEEGPGPNAVTWSPAPPVPAGIVADVLTTSEDGRARWTFPAAYEHPPVVTALAVDPDPQDDERAVWATLEEVTAWCATVRVWRSRPRRGAGVAEPAGEGLHVHVMACAVVPAHD